MTSKATTAAEPKQTVTPYLTVRNGAAAIDFYKNVFGAVEEYRLVDPDGRIAHADLKIGQTAIMLSDEHPEIDVLGPESRGGTTVGLHISVDDADRVFADALAAGAKSIRPVADQFYGERSGTLADPFGHHWFIASRKEEISPEEVRRRYEELIKQ